MFENKEYNVVSLFDGIYHTKNWVFKINFVYLHYGKINQ